MNYIRSLFFNFLVVFFMDRMSPGIEVTSFDQVPGMGGDLLFAAIIGFLNASIFPFFAIMEIPFSLFKLALVSGVISFGGFAIVSAVPFGLEVTSFAGFLLGAFVVWAVACLCNYLEWKRDSGES